MKPRALSRREFLASAAAGGVMLGGGMLVTATAMARKKTFTLLHTNDMHSALIGMGPASDYTPFELGNDGTRGGWARLGGLIARRREAQQRRGPVLVLDAGDFSMGTAFGAASRECGAELRLMAMMGYDATTFGNHEFDLGADGLGQAIAAAARAGRVPAVLPSNSDFTATDAALGDLQRLAKEQVIRRLLVVERGGVRFGLFGLLGKEAQFYTGGAGAVAFLDPIETAREMVKVLRERERVDVVICLSHGGVEKGKDGRYADGDDVRVARAVPGIDVVIGGHSHTMLDEPILVDGRTPVVQAGLEGRALGELVISLDGGHLSVDACRLHPIDDTLPGDRAIADVIEALKPVVTSSVFASRGYGIDEPLAIAAGDLPNTFTDIAAGTPLANLVTDALRRATRADIGLTANGMMRASLTRGKSGVQTVYDVFAVAPLGAGVVDATAGGALVTAYFTGLELKQVLEFFLVDNPAHPGEYFPRTSGMRFHYDMSRPKFDVVTAIDLGDLERGYRAIDISGKDARLYSLTCSLMLGLIVAGIPGYTKGELSFVPKSKEGRPLRSKVEALELPGESTPHLLPPPGQLDTSSLATAAGPGAVREIKEWQAIMDHLRALPVKRAGELPTIPIDGPALEVRAIRAGA